MNKDLKTALEDTRGYLIAKPEVFSKRSINLNVAFSKSKRISFSNIELTHYHRILGILKFFTLCRVDSE